MNIDSVSGGYYDVFVYGATPGGIGAALAAARRGRRTLLAEPSGHFGGMMTSGLGRTDIISLEASGAVFREFAGKVHRYYADTYGPDSEQVRDCNNGLFFEPSVAMRILREMAAGEPLLDIRMRRELAEATVLDGRLTAVKLIAAAGDAVSGVDDAEDKAGAKPDARTGGEGGRTGSMVETVRAGVFVDATYEGDLAAMAGVPWRLGRESRDEWNEEYAGKLYMNFDPSKEVFPGSTGEGDDRIQAYNFRLCLTQRPEIRVAVRKPETYDSADYESLVADVAAGRVKSIRDVMNILPVPNGKTDCNNHHYCMCSTDLPEENRSYATGDRSVRETFVKRQRDYVQGLLWFLQHDERLPQPFREEALTWGYAADEFAERDHFPPQIYVREARRIEGEYTFTENDARTAPGLGRAPVHPDSVAVGDYPIDSHATRKREPAGRNKALEGFLGLGWLTREYQIPYGVMLPKRVDGLLVPVAVSATHMGFGTIRMEPCWMQIGFAAGVAADLALKLGVSPRHVPVTVLQAELLAENQRITYFSDVPWEHPARTAAEFFGTKGFFASYEARLDEPLLATDASMWLAIARMLPGASALPALPASRRLLPAGVDMGPRLPKAEPSPEEQWRESPYLPVELAARWYKAARRAFGEREDASGERFLATVEGAVTRGEFCRMLYELVKTRQERMHRPH